MVLNLILNYWDNPSPVLLKETLLDIVEFGPKRSFLIMPNWKFRLTEDSLAKLSIKYLNTELVFPNETENRNNPFCLTKPMGTLEVNRFTLSMKIPTIEDMLKDLNIIL